MQTRPTIFDWEIFAQFHSDELIEKIIDMLGKKYEHEIIDAIRFLIKRSNNKVLMEVEIIKACRLANYPEVIKKVYENLKMEES